MTNSKTTRTRGVFAVTEKASFTTTARGVSAADRKLSPAMTAPTVWGSA